MSDKPDDSVDLASLQARIAANFERQVSWLSQLVRFRSVRGQERPCQEWIAREFALRGWDVDAFTLADVNISAVPGYAPMVEADPGASVQVVGRLPSPREVRGRSLILQGHVDVVPEGPKDMWERHPYSGEIADGWLHGRGSQDMKMGLSAFVFALDALAELGVQPASRVFVQSVTEEESTGNGALSTLARGYRADACLIPEPTANTITRAQTGAIWFRVSVRGKPVHVARSQTGSNAILSAYRLVRALEEMVREMNREAAADAWFGAVPDPIKLNVGIIRGGDWASSTPSWCDVDCRIGVLPGKDLQELRDAIEATVLSAAADDAFLKTAPPKVIWNGFQAEGSVLQPGSKAESTLGNAHKAVFGSEMTERVSTAVNDTRYYASNGIPSLCYGPAGKGMHGFNERADLANLQQTTLVIAKFVADWCGLVPSKGGGGPT